MGMSASQVRFLSLQNRKSHIGRELSTLSNRKMALSRDMQNVSRKYTNALNQTSYKFSNDAGCSYNTLTYNTLMSPNELNSVTPYIVTDAKTGKVVLNNDTIYDINGNAITFADGSSTGALTYSKIAKMISSYTAPTNIPASTSQLAQPNFHNSCVSAVSAAVDAGMAMPMMATILPSSAPTTGEANPDAYVIPKSNYAIDMVGSLRTEIFKKMGLISPEIASQYDSLVTQLYGSQNAMITGVYPVGSAMGNLELAKTNLKNKVLTTISEDYFNQINEQLQEKVDDAQAVVNRLKNSMDTIFTLSQQKQMDYYDALFLKIAQSGWILDQYTSTTNSGCNEYFNNKLQNNDYYIAECHSYEGSVGYKYTTKLAQNVSTIYSIHDTSAESAALAEYEAEKNLIHSKEQKIDNRMQKLETEQEAITQEADAIKKIIEDNIGTTFKIFT